MSRTLGIDQATQCGFAVLENGSPIHCGSWDLSIITPSRAKPGLPADPPAKRLVQLQHLVEVTCRSYDIDWIAYEKVTGGIKTGGAAGNLSRHLEAMIMFTAYKRNIPCIDYAAGTIKKHATGDGSWNTTKDKMIAAALKRWPDYFSEVEDTTKIDDNMVDAMWIADLCGLKNLHDW